MAFADAARRLAVLEAAQSIQNQGHSLREAARQIGISPANLLRWSRKYDAGGSQALEPRRSTGRPPIFRLTPAETECLRGWRLKKESVDMSLQYFVRDTECTEPTRELILAEFDAAARERRSPRWPLSLLRAAWTRPELDALFRGEKAILTLEMINRKGMFWIDETGAMHPVLPNSIYESDDMSLNEDFRWTDPETGQQLTGRQSLCTADVAADYFLAGTPIGRSRDAYRVEDIADHMLGVVEQFGLPLIWRLERGIWDNAFLHGLEIPGRDKPWGGLDEHLFRIVHTFKSKGKGTIENAFALLQRYMLHDSLSRGRFRGEFERQTKTFIQAQNGNASALAQIWKIDAAADALADAMRDFNRQPKTRHAYGPETVVPEELYRTAQMRPCPESELWRFCPVKKQGTIRNCCYTTSVPHYPREFRFVVNGINPEIYLSHGHSILAAFHPGHPERGCHIFNAETGVRNTESWSFGKHLLLAQLEQDAPQVDLRTTRSEDPQIAARRKANAAIRAEFRAVNPLGRNASASTSTARDGHGRSVQIVNRAGVNTLSEGDGMNGNRSEAAELGVARTSPPSGTTTRKSKPAPSGDDTAELNRIAALEARLNLNPF